METATGLAPERAMEMGSERDPRPPDTCGAAVPGLPGRSVRRWRSRPPAPPPAGVTKSGRSERRSDDPPVTAAAAESGEPCAQAIRSSREAVDGAGVGVVKGVVRTLLDVELALRQCSRNSTWALVDAAASVEGAKHEVPGVTGGPGRGDVGGAGGHHGRRLTAPQRAGAGPRGRAHRGQVAIGGRPSGRAPARLPYYCVLTPAPPAP